MLLAKALGATAAKAKESQQLRRAAASANRNIYAAPPPRPRGWGVGGYRLSKETAYAGGRRGSSSSCDADTAARDVAVTV